MTTSNPNLSPLPITHDAWFMRSTGKHYHDVCLPADCTPQFSDVQLDMSYRANIEQCRTILCDVCQKPLYLYPDRKEVEFATWPTPMLQTIEHANQFAASLIGKTVLDVGGQDYTVLHTWVTPPTAPTGRMVISEGQKGTVTALCELLPMEDEEQEEQPASIPLSPSHPLARETFSPPPWRTHHIGTARAWELVFSQADETIGVVISSEADARLIAEAPNMFALLKQFVALHDVEAIDDTCNCLDCQATRRLLARVLQGKEGKE